MTAELVENTLILIEWDDSFAPRGPWHDREDVTVDLDQNLIQSVGRLVTSDDRFVAIASDMWDEDSMVGGVFYIPQGCIRRVTVLSLDGEVVYDRQAQE